MKNLKLRSHKISEYTTYGKQNTLCIDPVSKSKYIVSDKGVFQVNKDIADNLPFSSLSWIDFNIHIKKIIGAEVITSLNSICVNSLDGDVITVNLEDHSVDVVGSVNDGIQSSIWSPDQELLTLVTGKFSVVLMTVDFEPISELSLEQDDFGESKFINIGWGKKETQFHGKEGKQAAKEIKSNSSTVFDWDSKAPKISWRGDGQLFAVSYVNSSHIRKIRVIDREGIIQSTSEDLEGLEEPLSWKPSGSLIASTQRLSNKHNVIFFEKNGLQHGNFTLPFNSMEVKVLEILWNSDSSILLVRIEPFDGKETIIQLWKVNNYYWYLKEELKFEENIFDLKWDIEVPLLLYIVSQNYIHDISFVHCINGSHGTSMNDTAQVSVIDGNKLLVTPFSQAVIPPPMCAYEIVFPDQIHSVNYAPSKCDKSSESLNSSLAIEDSGFLEAVDSPGSNSNNLCIFHGQNMLTFLVQAHPNEQLSDFGVKVNIICADRNGFSAKTCVHRVFSQLKLELDNGLLETKNILTTGHLYNWFWVTKNSFLCCLVTKNKNSVILFDFEGLGTEFGKISLRKSVDVEGEVVSVSSTPDGSIVCLQLYSGELLKLNMTEEISIIPWTEDGIEIQFPGICDEVILFPALDKKYIPLGLTSRNRLYLGNYQLLSDCTSLYLHNNHILLTTTTHQLLVVPLYLEALKSISDRLKNECSKVGTRRLERGSRIVRAVPGDTKVLLQMPRGNLEMINPRPLLVHKLKTLLDDKNYGTSIKIMRKHRIDMNMIYDHNPREFLSSLNEFVRSVDSSHLIDLFITSLNNGNLNPVIDPDNPIYPNVDGGEVDLHKSDIVCELIRQAMEKVDQEKYLLPILSTYVKSSRKRLNRALLLLKNMKNDQNKVYKVSFEEGLRHLLYVSDVNELCDIALGMYDFELVMMVYESSQKDPKEYLPFLNNLWQLEENYRKYKINVYLKRYDKALLCMELCDESYNDEFLSLIKKESLYDESLQNLSYQSTLYFAVCVSYGDHLLEKGYLNEAAAMYIRGLNPERAFEVYSLTDNWKRVLITAFELNFSKEKINRLYYSLVEKLISKDCYADAAFIYDKYIQSEEDAVECFCKANQFEDAFLVSSKYGRSDLVDTHIKPAIVERSRSFEEEISNKLLQFKTNLNRLTVVRSQKKNEYIHLIEGNVPHIDSDLYSDSSTVTGFTQQSNISKPMTNATLVSGKTYRSSKNKRKLDRKKFSTKEGSTNEDLGIVILLHDLMNSIPPLTNDISDFNRTLLLFPGYELYGRLFQSELSKLIKEMQKHKYTIWTNCAPLNEDSVEFGPHMTAESAARQIVGNIYNERDFIVKRMEELEPQYRYPPNIDKLTNWKLYSLRNYKEL